MEIDYNDLDWKKLLIKKYVNYGLDECSVMILFVSDMILEKEEKTLISCDVLAPYMRANKDDIDSALSNLISKNVMTIVNDGSSFYSSIKGFKETLFNDAMKDYALRLKTGVSATDSNFYTDIEKITSKTLTAIERDTISRWLRDGVDESAIKEALQRSLTKSGNISFKMAEKIILQLQRSESRKTVGASTVNEDTRKRQEITDLFENTDWTYHG